MQGVLIVMVIFMIPIVAIIGMTVRRIRERDCLHKERLVAMERGGVPPLSALSDTAPAETVRRSTRSGVVIHGIVWTGVGAGLLLAIATVARLQANDDLRTLMALLQLWAYPALLVGIGLLAYGIISRERRRNADT